jgi:hypothetical protein
MMRRSAARCAGMPGRTQSPLITVFFSDWRLDQAARPYVQVVDEDRHDECEAAELGFEGTGSESRTDLGTGRCGLDTCDINRHFRHHRQTVN